MGPSGPSNAPAKVHRSADTLPKASPLLSELRVSSFCPLFSRTCCYQMPGPKPPPAGDWQLAERMAKRQVEMVNLPGAFPRNSSQQSLLSEARALKVSMELLNDRYVTSQHDIQIYNTHTHATHTHTHNTHTHINIYERADTHTQHSHAHNTHNTRAHSSEDEVFTVQELRRRVVEGVRRLATLHSPGDAGCRRTHVVWCQDLGVVHAAFAGVEGCSIRVTPKGVVHVEFTCLTLFLRWAKKAESYFTRFDSDAAPMNQRQPRSTLLVTDRYKLKLSFRALRKIEVLPREDLTVGCLCPRSACSFLGGAVLTEAREIPPERPNTEGYASLEARMYAEVDRLPAKRARTASSSSSNVTVPLPKPRVVGLSQEYSRPTVNPVAVCAMAGGETPCTKSARLVFCRYTAKWWCAKHHSNGRVVENNGRQTRTVLSHRLTITANFYDPFVLHVAHGIIHSRGGAVSDDQAPDSSESEDSDAEPDHATFGENGPCSECGDAMTRVLRWDGFAEPVAGWRCSNNISQGE